MSLLGGLVDRVRTVAGAPDRSPDGSADAGDGTRGTGTRRDDEPPAEDAGDDDPVEPATPVAPAAGTAVDGDADTRSDAGTGSSSRAASVRPTRSYVDLDAIPVRDADAYVDLEDLVDDRADAYVDLAPMVDDAPSGAETGAVDPDDPAGAGPDSTADHAAGGSTAGGSTGGHGGVDRSDVDSDGGGPGEGIGTAAGTDGADPPEIELSVTFDPSSGGDWVDALGADDGEDGEADEEFDVVTGFASRGERPGRHWTGDRAADAGDARRDDAPADDVDDGRGTTGDGWSAAAPLDPEKVTRTRVSAADVDTGAAIGQADDPPIDIDDVVGGEPGDDAPTGLDPDEVTRASATATDEAVAKLELFDSRAARRDDEGRRGFP